MSVGQSAVHANAILDTMRGNAMAAFTPYLKLHTGDPGAAGAANASAETDRVLLVFAAPANGSTTAAVAAWAGWNVGTENITHVSLWTLAAGGVFRGSGILDASQNVQDGDTLNVTVTATQGPIAA